MATTKNTTQVVRIKECVCGPHEYQDHRYGKNMRVMNPCGSSKNTKGGYRCTVCGRIHE